MDTPFDAVVADDVEAVDGGGIGALWSIFQAMVTVGRLEAVGNRLPIHYAFEGGFVAGEEAAYDLDAVVFLQFEFAGGGYFVVGGEVGDGLLEELELALGDLGVGGAGAGALAVAPGEVADAGEEGSDVGQFGAEEDYAVDEGALFDYDFLADGAGDFLTGVEELDGGERGVGCAVWSIGG